MDKNYLDLLRKTELRPGKVRLKEKAEEILLENEERSMADIHTTIMQWFKKNPNPKDSAVRDLAKEMGMSEDEVEEHIYMILTSMLKKYPVAESRYLMELFIQQGEIEAMPAGSNKEMAMLRLSMIAELDAANLYERFAELTSNSDVKKIMLDVAKEEKVHAGEFESLLEDIDSEHDIAKKEGEDEVEEKT